MAIFSQNPDRKRIEGYANEFRDLRTADGPRIERYLRYREENETSRSVTVDQHVADLKDYGRRPRQSEPSRHKIPLPLGMALTVKHAYRIAGRLPDVIVDRREETPLERHRSATMEKIVWAIIRASRGDTQIADAAWDGSLLGSGCLDLYFDIKQQMPMLRSDDPVGIVVVKGVDDPHDFQRVYKSWDVPLHELKAQYRDHDFNGAPVAVGDITKTHAEGTVELVTVVQMCDRQRKVHFALGGDVPLYENQHDYGFVPKVIIPNIGPEREVWGWADYEFVRGLVHYLPALYSREADILRAVANGAYQDNGSGQNPDTIRDILSKGGVLPTKREARVEPIQVADVPAFEQAHAERGLELFKMLSFAPDAAWGNGETRSGTDRGLQLMPLIELTAMKQKNWQAGLSRLFGMGYQMMEQKMVGKARYRGAVRGGGLKRTPFNITVGPEAPATEIRNPSHDPEDPAGSLEPELLELPNTPKELFDGDYEVRFVWQNRVDPDDPAFVASELNKFAQGVQSAVTTMERLGIQSPEDELKLIEQESERMPWLRQGMIALLKAELQAEASGGGGGKISGDGGAPPDDLGALAGALGTMTGGGGGTSGALDADAATAALPGGGGQTTPYGAA